MGRRSKWVVSERDARDLFAQGLTLTAIAAALSVPYGSVYRVLRWGTKRYGPKCPRSVRARNWYSKNRDRLCAESRARHALDPEKSRVRGIAYRARVGKETLRAKAHARRWACIEAARASERARSKKQRDADPERFREKERLYRRTHRTVRNEQRMRYAKHAHYLTRDDREFVYHIWGECCAYCGMRFRNDRERSIDHIDALSKGGERSLENVAAACVRCNSSKGDSALETWRPTVAKNVRARAAVFGREYCLRSR